MKAYKQIRCLAALLSSILSVTTATAQIKVGNGIEVDSNVHDFGEVILNSGPLSCTFKVTNNGEKPVVIYSVQSSCGCTDVKWTQEPLRPGESGTISATYSNDEAPIPFDKSLTVYFSGIRKPYILKLRGICREPELSKEEIYPHRAGKLGFRSLELNIGQLKQGAVKSEVLNAANLSKSPAVLKFEKPSPGLTVSVRKAGDGTALDDGVVPAGAEIEIVFTVTADRSRWGKNRYTVTPVVDGKRMQEIKVFAFTVENFDSLDAEQKRKGPNPAFKESTFSFGIKKTGTVIHAEFEMKNVGEKTLRIYKCDTDARNYSHSDIYPVKPGETGKFRVHIDTSLMPKGETGTIVTLTTNSPLRPIVKLFIVGYLE